MILVAASLAALAAWVGLGSSGRFRLPKTQGGASSAPRESRNLPMLPAVGVMSVAVAVLIGGAAGVLAGVACWVVLPRLIRRLEPGAVRRRRQVLHRQAPQAADLLAAVVECGATPHEALSVVAKALGPPLAHDLTLVLGMLELGASPEQAWDVLPRDHPLAPVGQAFRRSAGSGASLQGVLTALAEDLRRRRRVELEVAARSAGVRAVGPLAACFLPAFVLVGIVPVVASFATRLL